MYIFTCIFINLSFDLYSLDLARENLARSDPVIIPYRVINVRFKTLYGIITESLSAMRCIDLRMSAHYELVKLDFKISNHAPSLHRVEPVYFQYIYS